MTSTRTLHAVAAAVLIAAAAPGAPRAATIPVTARDMDRLPAIMWQAQPGDTLLVGPGDYRGRFILPAGVVLQSTAGPDSTRLRGDFIATVEVQGKAGGTEIRGFTMTGRAGADLGVEDPGLSVLVEKNVFVDIHDGVNVKGGEPVIHDNIFRNCTRGVALVAANGTIEHNVFEHNQTAIDLDSASPLVRRNRITGSSQGIMLAEYSYPLIGGEMGLANDFSDNQKHIVNRSLKTIGVQRTQDPGLAMARYNYWGEPCPAPIRFYGACQIRPWTDASHREKVNACPDSTGAARVGEGGAAGAGAGGSGGTQ